MNIHSPVFDDVACCARDMHISVPRSGHPPARANDRINIVQCFLGSSGRAQRMEAVKPMIYHENSLLSKIRGAESRKCAPIGKSGGYGGEDGSKTTLRFYFPSFS